MNNEQIRSLRSIPQYFVSIPKTTHGGVVRPLVYVYQTVFYRAGKGEPWALRLFLIACHALAGLILVTVVRAAIRQLRTPDGSPRESVAPWLAGWLFVAHPIHVEAVTWLSGGGYCVSGLLTLAALALFQHGRIAASLVACGLGMLTTEMAVVLPVALLTYQLLRRDRPPSSTQSRARRVWAIVVPLLPYFTLTAGYLVYRMLLLGSFGRGIPHYGGSLLVSALSMMRVVLDYLQLLIVPGNLLVDHAFLLLGRDQVWYLILVGEVLLFLALGFWVIRRRDPAGFFFFAFFVVALAPVSNLVPTGGTPEAERYLFTPSAGIVAILALTLDGVARYGLHVVEAARRMSLRAPVLAAGFIVTALFAARTLIQTQVWSGEEPLWREALLQNLFNPRAHGNYCASLWSRGDPVELLSAYQRAERYTGGFQGDLAAVYLMLGRRDDAREALRRGTILNPEDEAGQRRWGRKLLDDGHVDSAYRCLIQYKGKDRDAGYLIALATAAEVRGDRRTYERVRGEVQDRFPDLAGRMDRLRAYHLQTRGRYADAVREWERHVAAGDSSFTDLTAFSISLSSAGLDERAAAIFERAVARFPDSWEAHHNLARFWIQRGRYAAAIPVAERGLQISGESPELLNTLAYCRFVNGDTTGARALFQRVHEGWPNYHLAYVTLGRIYTRDGRWNEARALLERYVFLRNTEPEGYTYLADLYGAMGEPRLERHHRRAAEMSRRDGPRASAPAGTDSTAAPIIDAGETGS